MPEFYIIGLIARKIFFLKFFGRARPSPSTPASYAATPRTRNTITRYGTVTICNML